MESNDSPEIPDRGETSDISGLPSGAIEKTNIFKNYPFGITPVKKKKKKHIRLGTL